MMEMIQMFQDACKTNPMCRVWIGLIIFGFISSLLGIAGMIYYGLILGV